MIKRRITAAKTPITNPTYWFVKASSLIAVLTVKQKHITNKHKWKLNKRNKLSFSDNSITNYSIRNETSTN